MNDELKNKFQYELLASVTVFIMEFSKNNNISFNDAMTLLDDKIDISHNDALKIIKDTALLDAIKGDK